MRQKMTFFDRKRDDPASHTSTRLPWRARRRERVEPRRASTSQSEFNSIQINTADYPPDLLRKFDDERINISSVSQPKSERDQQPHPSNTNELERVQSEERNSRLKQNARRRPGECLFITSGFRVHANASSNVKEIVSATEGLSDGHSDGLFPFPEQSREGFFLRGKGCLLILFILFALTMVIGLSWYYSCNSSLKTRTVHSFVTANPVARLLGITSIVDETSDARHLWINHVVKNDDNQILIAETFESRLNAEISPLLDKYVDKIWGDPSSTSVTCHGGDRLMVAFSMAKAGSMPASITYETPCINGPSFRSCVVKKQIADVRDLVVRLPSKSSRYMHAVSLVVDHSSKEGPKNSSEVRDIQDLGMVSGQFRVEMSDASRLALQRYCGQNPLAYSDDLLTEPVSERNTRLINVYELKRLYGLLSSQSGTPISGAIRGSSAWDSRMLSTVVIDPLEHSRHSLAPLHLQQLMSRRHSVSDSQSLPRSHDPESPRIAASIPQENNPVRHSAAPSQHVSERNGDIVEGSLSPTSHLAFPSSSTSSPSPPLSSPSPAQAVTKEKVQSFNVQPPASPTSAVERLSKKKFTLRSQSDSHSAHLRTSTEPTASSSLTDGAILNKTRSETNDHSMRTDDDKKSILDLESSVPHDGTTADGTTGGRKMTTLSGHDERNYYNATRIALVSSRRKSPPALSERSTANPASNKASAPFVQEELTAHQSEASSRSVPETTRIPHVPRHSEPSSSAPPNQALSPAGTSILGQKTPFASKLTKPTSLPSGRLGVGPQETQRKFPTLLDTGAQIDRTEHRTTRGTTTQRRTNTARGPPKPNSVIQPTNGRTKHLPKGVPSRPVQSGLFRNQEPLSRNKRTFSSTPIQSSPAQELSPSAKEISSISSVGAISLPRRKASPMNKLLLSPAHGSSSAAQKRPSSMRGTMTPTGQVLSPRNTGIQLTRVGLPATKDVRPNEREQLTRDPWSQPAHPRSTTRTQMIMRGQKQSDMRGRTPRGLAGRYPTRTGVLAAMDSQTGTQPRYPKRESG